VVLIEAGNWAADEELDEQSDAIQHVKQNLEQ
jgi:hypothetical protein